MLTIMHGRATPTSRFIRCSGRPLLFRKLRKHRKPPKLWRCPSLCKIQALSTLTYSSYNSSSNSNSSSNNSSSNRSRHSRSNLGRLAMGRRQY